MSTLEYVPGESLAERLAREALPIEEAVRIASEIAEALGTAHKVGILRRGVNPSNIRLADGQVKVMGFGLAESVVSDSPGAVESLIYLSPEELRGEAVDARSDVFSLGLVLYEMLAGVHPFKRATPADTTAAILTEPHAPLSQHRKEAPELLQYVVGKMLAKAPAERHQLVHEVRTDLNRVRESLGEVVTALPTSPPTGRWSRRLGIGLAAVAALAALAAFWAWWSASSRESTSSRRLASVAVLPLRNISDEPLDTDYLADGISQAVTTKLTQVGLRVTPWETARRYRDAGPAEAIARELNVDAVLVGTLQVAGDEILANLSLIDAKSGFQSWADMMIEPYDDLFRMQIRIATAVATSLNEELTREEEKALAAPESRSVDAYDLFLQGAHVMQEGTEQAADVAFEYFSRAVELDEGLAEAHVGLGTVYYDRYFNGWEGGSLDQASGSFETALQLNPASMRARRGLILVSWERGQSEACLIQGQLAARLGRADDVETLLARADAYLFGGMPDRSLPLFHKAIELDPANQAAHWHLPIAHIVAGEPEKTIQAGEVYFDRFGDDDEIHLWVGVAHQLLGDDERALAHYRKASPSKEVGESTASSANVIALLYRGVLHDRLGDRERAEEAWLRGVELLKPKLEAHPDLVKMRILLSCFYGLLGERDSFLADERRALSAQVNALQLYYLAGVHAQLGETERAVALFRRTVEQGRINPEWKRYLEVASVTLEPDAFDEFLEAYEAEERRLREKY